MSATFVSRGESIDYTPEEDIAAGQVVRLNSILAVALSPILAGQLGSLKTEGVFSFPKLTGGGTALSQGDIVRWNEAGHVEPEDESYSDLVAGPVWADAATTDEEVLVKLDCYLSPTHHSQIP